VLVDTRVRGVPVDVPADEDSPLDEAAAAITEGDLPTLGHLLTAAHEARDRDEAQHVAVSMALRAGALGARAIADGPGRPVCALIPVDRLGDVRSAVSGGFADRDLRPPRFLTFAPGTA
jgi:galactokinase